jgi:large subunit GTPase 1
LGKALRNRLEKKRFVGTGEKAPIFFQETEQNDAQLKKMKMQSVIEQNSLTEFLQVAQMSQQDFHANRDIKFRDIREELTSKRILPNHSDLPRFTRPPVPPHLLQGVQVPRRPPWKTTKGKEELEQLENEAYLSWRRKLAEIEEKNPTLSITPYEKNLEVWRQLWRVVERVDVLVQIVDGRNPLFFYSEDLINYGKELGKSKFLLVVNKSDLIEEATRLKWNQYFLEQGINHLFFTAKDNPLTEEPVQPAAINTDRVLTPQQLIAIFHQYVQ